MLNIPQSQYHLKTETTFLLTKAGIDEALLTFRDHVDLAGVHRSRKLKLTLVDHNVLPKCDSLLEDVVVTVIDHRKQERLSTEK